MEMHFNQHAINENIGGYLMSGYYTLDVMLDNVVQSIKVYEIRRKPNVLDFTVMGQDNLSRKGEILAALYQ